MFGIGIVGASGFTGAELLRLCAGHPDISVVAATGDSQAGTPIADLYPSLAGAYDGQRFDEYSAELVDGLDLVFLGLPHGASQAIVPELIGRVGHLVDLAADFRLQDADLYPQWYGEKHTCPELLPEFAYGIPELFRDEIAEHDHVAAAGCYPTAATLGLAPLARAGVIETDRIIVDAASGVSGAGRPPKPNTTFCTVDEDFTAYGLLDHRHTAEMETVLGATVLFTPHLAPMNRGILATCYARPTRPTSTDDLLALLAGYYADEPFVVVDERSPSTKATLGSNTAHLTARYDERTNLVVVIVAIDNLTKGASGQAIQCANILLELDEASGLAATGVYP
jgi:N-acetyl-gamma-glutamyl-phosphate reductase